MKFVIAGVLFLSFVFSSTQISAQNSNSEIIVAEMPDHTEETQDDSEHHHEENGESYESHGQSPSFLSVLPFILLLGMIATGPLFYAHFWHKNYPLIAVILGSITVAYYLFFLHDTHHPLHSLQEYVSFIALLTALFVASGGIMIKVDQKGTPLVNIILLIIGAALANIIGTTGASMLLIRPFIRLNKDRIRPYHIVFFIFMVSNVGGCLTPIGDPPLFLGFLKGIPFFWTVEKLWLQWIFGVSLLAIVFYFLDKRNKTAEEGSNSYSGKIEVGGLKNLIFLGIIIGAVFLDPGVVSWVPGIYYEGIQFSFVRETIMLVTAYLAYKMGDKKSLQANEFNFEPIKEVAFLFVGIFATMMPALQLIAEFAFSPGGQELVNTHTLYWSTGMLSGVLDNAPTYLNFLSAGMGKEGLDIASKVDVLGFSQNHIIELVAISVGAVFFGAFTYIGNAPNFMVKSIAEQLGIKMPSFIGYVIRYSIPYLLPILLITWIVFFLL